MRADTAMIGDVLTVIFLIGAGLAGCVLFGCISLFKSAKLVVLEKPSAPLGDQTSD
ncbi:hypothetical protein [Lacisediminihabitans changchengi]|uniref:Uncharacterized protein n=1 Tax=Lacisediminihabitans changchengi TaxID=2787634 RepID=A0A934W3T6_9MICO|nr:hypothetical protein [Lacisediminihabitans changchengi]MBK4348226.1 hypothetical protein [Lacisediminihabitans changchengi]